MKLARFIQAIKLSSLAILSVGLLSCGEDEESKLVKVSISPGTPIVINSSWKVIVVEEGEEKEKTFDGPWFKFNYSIDNQSDRSLSIAGISAKIKTFRFGRQVEGLFEFPVPATIPLHIEVPPKTTANLIQNMVAYGLPESDTGSWSVELIFEGWYGTYQEPEKSYKKSFFFNANN